MMLEVRLLQRSSSSKDCSTSPYIGFTEDRIRSLWGPMGMKTAQRAKHTEAAAGGHLLVTVLLCK